MRKYLVIILLLVDICGCATSYQKAGTTGGYSDIKLGKDLYQVSFRGNGYTGSGRVQSFFLRRCAELTIEQGYKYFAFVKEEAEITQESLGTTYNGDISQNYGGSYSYSGTANTTVVNRHKRTGVIKMFNEGSQPSVAYDAKEVLSNFKD